VEQEIIRAVGKKEKHLTQKATRRKIKNDIGESE